MRPGLAVLLALASCATGSAREPPLAVSATPAGEGDLRVRFRRPGGADPDRPPEFRAERGRLDEIVVSPDLRAASALWRGPGGEISCRFPYDGTARFSSLDPADPATVEYVFLETPGARVTADLPLACLLLPSIPLRVRIDAALRPACLVLPDGRRLPVEDGRLDAALPLPRDDRGVLRRGDLEVTIETALGATAFLVGIDADGTPAATSGYVRAALHAGGTPSGEARRVPGMALESARHVGR